MDSIAQRVTELLRRSPAPAVRLRDLCRALQDSGVARVDPETLARRLSIDPGRFLLIDPWGRLWRSSRREPARAGAVADVWVAAADGGDDPDPDAPPLALRLRRTVHWLGRRLDRRSATETARWLGMAREASAVAPKLRRAA